MSLERSCSVLSVALLAACFLAGAPVVSDAEECDFQTGRESGAAAPAAPGEGGSTASASGPAVPAGVHAEESSSEEAVPADEADSQGGREGAADSQGGREDEADSQGGREDEADSQGGRKGAADSQGGREDEADSQGGREDEADSQGGREGAGGAVSSQAEEEIAADVREGLLGVLPEGGFFEELDLDEPVVFYGPKTLYEYINGQAEGYLSYGFRALASATYLQGGDSVVVDVYDMGAPIRAFGVYSTFRSPANEFLEIGRECIRLADGLMFWKGRMAVQVSADFADEARGEKAALAAAKAAAARIEDSGEGLEVLELLPPEGRVEASATYVLDGVLGQSFLSNGVVARYRVGSEVCRLFVCQYVSDEAAADAYAKYLNFARAHGEPAEAEKGREFYGRIKYYGMTAVFRHGRYLAGGTGLPDRWGSLFGRLKNHVEERAAP